ncbi:UDP-N-acetylmuramoyl-tripeptide--D-alanyl-D-alanine ligase [Roseovarius sp. MMSF_3281]|uniref:UDP-N-acetylmuramoyl-tripeptide--D-alanyl-D- alanine ligase n=1 Tax=Roseovarius sp. MMSF_3281 TaxID=3046694 RepID=UPI00273D5D9C|nr:UDP-N-acetylmuramoyl-tripeptide--D-alanyl-D-alanine ligase [Roseovarius sp. MMSF_3281]
MPDDSRKVAGASTHFPTYRPDDIVFIRSKDNNFGVPADVLARKNVSPRLAIVSDMPPGDLKAEAVFQVPDQKAALFTLARAARKRINVPVIAVTGSSGKSSTTDLIGHTLEALGPVYRTREGANLPRGVAWNLACVSEDDKFVALELAIGGMQDNTALARPDIAVFTNIHLAHVIYHRDLRTIAERKARIFEGVNPGGCVILNSGMNEGAYLDKCARSKGLRVIYYGRRAKDHVRLLRFEASKGIADIAIGKKLLRLEQCMRHGVHMLENFMAACAVHLALGVPLNNLAKRYATFNVTSGRGTAHQLAVEDGNCTLLDHSYNANPASMRAALVHLRNTPTNGRRIAVLGAMAELGDLCAEEHEKLVAYIETLGLDRVYTLGAEFTRAARLPGHVTMKSPEALWDILGSELQSDDVILVKGSNSTGLNHVVKGVLRERLGQ